MKYLKNLIFSAYCYNSLLSHYVTVTYNILFKYYNNINLSDE